MPYYDTVTSVLEKKITVPITVWTALRYGTSNAKGRKYIGVFNRSAVGVVITTDNNDTAGISLTTDPHYCRYIRPGGERIFPYSDKVTLYAMSRHATDSARLIVTEECG